MAERYKRGDILLEFLNQKVLETPQMLQQWRASKRDDARIKAENRRLDLIAEGQEKDREFRRQQARINQQNRIEARAYKAEQDKKSEMNTLLRSVTEPYQRQAIYSKYGMYDMADQMRVQGDKEEDQKTSLKSFYAVSSAKDIVSEGNKALEGLDPTSAAYGQVVARRDSAFNEIQNSYQDMLKDPRYKFQYDILLASAKMPNADIPGIFQQMDVMANRFEEEKFGDKENEEDEDDKLLSIDEQAERLVSDILFKPEDSLDLGPQTEEDIRQVATQIETSSDINIGKLQGSLPKLENRKNILERTSKLRNLTEVQAKELEQINAAIKATKAEIKKQKRSLGQAKRETELFRGISTSPLRG
jgi:hypothetical protein